MGGIAGGMNSGITLLLRNAGAATRFASVWASILSFIVLLASVPVFTYFPTPVLGGQLAGGPATCATGCGTPTANCRTSNTG